MLRLHFRPKRRTSPYLVLVAAALLIGPMAGIAQAQEVCTVNGTEVTIGQDVNGTPDDDLIVCVGVVTGFNIYGHGGDDTIITTDITQGGIYGGEGGDTVETGALTPTGSGITAYIYGQGGDDTITTGAVTAAVNGSFFQPAVVYGGSGNDDITTGVINQSEVRGEAGADSITAAALTGKLTLSGGEDDDTITITGSVADGFGFTSGDSGNDVITVGEYIGVVWGGPGGDRLTSLAPVVTEAALEGGRGEDTLQAQAVALQGRIRGGSDNDLIEGLAGAPAEVLPGGRVDGGAGQDVCDVFPLGGTVTGCP
ncbi:hypothetical protein [Streptomyces lavendulocolor]|uniref:hypothetical protein n=1 Tax=Streptomyces lavendulocolor TaxID=67316 RepID=UPI003C2C5A70